MTAPADLDWQAVRHVLVEDHSFDPDLARRFVEQYRDEPLAMTGDDVRVVEDAIDTVRRRG